MGASSVTGVGQGSADKAGQKGSEHLFVGVEKLIGVRVVHAGLVTLAAGVKAVTFPVVLPGASTDYVVVATEVGTAKNPVSVSALTTSGFTLNGTTTSQVYYMVVRVDNATVTVG